MSNTEQEIKSSFKHLNIKAKEFIPKEKRASPTKTQNSNIEAQLNIEASNVDNNDLNNTNLTNTANQANLLKFSLDAKEYTPTSKSENTIKFRLDSQEYIPTSKRVKPERVEQNIKFKLDSKEYIPKSTPSNYNNINYYYSPSTFTQIPNSYELYENSYTPDLPQINYSNEYYNKYFQEDLVIDEDEDENLDEEDSDDEMAEKMFDDMIEENNFFDEDDESDDEKWFPKYRLCECCKGFVYKCEGETCKSLGKCYCKIKAQIDGDLDD